MVFFLLGAMTIVEIVDSHQGQYVRVIVKCNECVGILAHALQNMHAIDACCCPLLEVSLQWMTLQSFYISLSVK